MTCRLILFAVVALIGSTTSAVAATATKIPFSDDGTCIRIPVDVFGETRYFIVDVGASNTIIDSRFIPQLGARLEIARQETTGADVHTVVYTAPKMVAGSMPLDLERILTADLTMMRRITGESCDGMLGLDVLAKYVVELDFVKKIMVLTDRAHSPAGALGIPMEPLGRAFGVRVEINGAHPLTALVDTGANSSVSLNEAAWNAAFSEEERAGSSSTVFAATGGQVITSRMIRVRQLKIGSEQYQDLVCTLIGRNALPSIGLPLLRQHHVIFDFPGKILYLSERKSARDETDMSGLHLLKIDGNVVVYSVDERSPAAQGGILPNDIIISIDDAEAGKSTMNSLRQRLTNADGATRLIVIERNGKLLRLSVRLRRVV